MKKNVLLQTLLITGLVALSSSQVAFANGGGCSSSASQTITGKLGPLKQVVTNGGNIAAVIDETTGVLSAALTPAFTLTTNTSSPIDVRMTSSCNTTTVPQNAFFGDGNTGSTYLVLTNNTALPTVTAVDDAKAAVPAPAVNANVIAYGITKPADVAGKLVYIWDNPFQYYNASLTNKGGTNTLLNIPGTPRPLTFSIEDVDGTYQSTITLSFV